MVEREGEKRTVKETRKKALNDKRSNNSESNEDGDSSNDVSGNGIPGLPVGGGDKGPKGPEKVIWGDFHLRWQDVISVAKSGAELQLSVGAWNCINNARGIVDKIVADGKPVYGINTGLGALSVSSLKEDQLDQLSRNTIMSHACGVGPKLSNIQVRAIMCAAIAQYTHGKSGVSSIVVKGLLAMLNRGITPQVPSQGSISYSTHMAHAGLALIGIGNVSYRGDIVPATDALTAEGLEPCHLGAKDGLCLVNSTSSMTGLSCLGLDEAQRLMDWVDVISAMSFEALCGQLDAFDLEALALKEDNAPTGNVQLVGKRLRALLSGSKIVANSEGISTQDALSLRSIPQIHGACRNQFDHAAQQIETELNSASDNPLLLGTTESWWAVSQANPHGESVAMAADLLAIALAEIGSVSMRRLDRLINPLVSGLPPFLVAESGVNCGMIIAQHVAASLCRENRQLAQPAVLDNFATSGLQDHFSMGTTAALKLLKLVENDWHILAMEYMLAAQALDLRKKESGIGTKMAWAMIRKHIQTWTQDRWLAPDIEKVAVLIKTRDIRV